MPRAAESIGRKWNSALKEAIPDAKLAYARELPNTRAKLQDPAVHTKMKTAYASAVGGTEYIRRVGVGLATGKADVAYNERLDQIAITDTTEAQQNKMVEQTKLRRHLESLNGAAVALINANTSGSVKFNLSYSDKQKKIIVNIAAMRNSPYFTTDTTAEQMVARFLADKDNLEGLVAAD